MVDAAVKAKAGKPVMVLDNAVPLVISNPVGKGKAIFLNLSLGKILANYAGDAATRAFLLSFLQDAGIFTGLRAPAGYQVVRFQGDGYELLSCRETSEGKDGETLQLGKTYHVYDARQAKYLGAVDSLAPSACAGRNNLFTLLPSRACAWTIAFAKVITPGDIAVATIHMLPSAGSCQPRRLFRVRGRARRGRSSRRCGRFADGAEGCTFNLPFALNQAAGKYQLEVKDILTGVTERMAFQVK